MLENIMRMKYMNYYNSRHENKVCYYICNPGSLSLLPLHRIQQGEAYRI